MARDGGAMSEVTAGPQNPSDGQFRHATVLFADLSGYTGVVARLRGQLELVERLGESLDGIAYRVIPRHRGIVNEVRGDGIVALFGLSGADEFDVRDAVDAALELHHLVRAESAEWGVGGALDLHSGIHAGLVLVRRGTRDQRLYRVSGDPMIVAARLSEHAKAGEVIASATSLQGVREFYRTRQNGQLQIETLGMIETVSIQDHSGVTRQFEARARRGLSIFTGREDALATLDAALHKALQGHLQEVRIVGMSGVGKTRLAEEFLNRSFASDVQIVRGYCAPLEQSVALQPFQQIVEQIVRTSGANPDRMDSSNPARVMAAALPASSNRLEALQHLLSPGAVDPGPADAVGSHVVDAVAETLIEAAQHRPLIVFLDDWQWADKSSMAVLAKLGEQAAEARILLLVTSRDPHIDAGKRAVNVIKLQGLGAAETAAIAKALLPGIPDLGVLDSIYRKTGGNPLYVEELCRSGSRSLILHETVPEDPFREVAPHWIARLIANRVGACSPRAQEAVSTAAVIGRIVPRWLFESLLGPAYSDEMMKELAEADLMFAGSASEALGFKHGLTRDIVYDLVGYRLRRDLHRRIAECIELRAGDGNIAEHFEALAYHHRGAENFDKGVEYAEKAADKARSRAALDVALAQYQAALHMLDRMTPTPEVQLRRWSITRNWAQVCIFVPAAAQLERFRKQIAYAEQAGDAPSKARALCLVGYLSYTLGRHNEALDYFEQARQAAQELGITSLLARVMAGIGHLRSARGDTVEAIASLDAALELWRANPPRDPQVVKAYSLACKGLAFADMGELARGRSLIGESRALLADSGHQMEGSIRCFESVMLLWEGRWHEARETADVARKIGQRVNGPYMYAMATAIYSYAQWQLERTKESVEALRHAAGWLEEWDVRLYLSLIYGWLIEVLIGEGRLDEAARYYRLSREDREREGELLGAELGARAMARAAAKSHEGALGPFTTYLDHAREIAERRQSRVQHALNALCEAELFETTGAQQRAAECARFALDEIRAIGLDCYASEAEAIVTRLSGRSEPSAA
jgi:class 3 adenylate cyclase/tetratricopeptide (TPR) repeat protein